MCQWTSALINEMNLTDVTFVPSNGFYWLYVAIDLFELVLSCVSIMFVAIGLYVFVSCPLFSSNLMRLIYTIAMNFYGMLLSRIFVVFYMLMLNGYPASSVIHFFSCIPQIERFEYAQIGFIGSYLAAVGSLAAERFMAIIFLSTYEKRNCFSLILFSIAIQLFVLCAVVTILLYDLFKYEYLVLIAAFSNAFIFFCFMLAERINRRLYKNVQSIVGIYTLSERYQLSENVRTCGIMKRVLIMSFMLNIICQVAVFIDIISTNIFVRQFAAVAFNFTILFYGIAFVTIPMSRVDPWKRKCVRLMRHFRSHFTCAFLNTVYPTRTIEQSRPVLLTLIEGDRMNFTVKEGTDVYFRTLAKQWEEPTITT